MFWVLGSKAVSPPLFPHPILILSVPLPPFTSRKRGNQVVPEWRLHVLVSGGTLLPLGAVGVAVFHAGGRSWGSADCVR